MKLAKRESIFLIISVIILAAAVIFMLVGARVSGPEITYYEFSIPVTYEEYGEVKTQTVTYCGQSFCKQVVEARFVKDGRDLREE